MHRFCGSWLYRAFCFPFIPSSSPPICWAISWAWPFKAHQLHVLCSPTRIEFGRRSEICSRRDCVLPPCSLPQEIYIRISILICAIIPPRCTKPLSAERSSSCSRREFVKKRLRRRHFKNSETVLGGMFPPLYAYLFYYRYAR